MGKSEHKKQKDKMKKRRKQQARIQAAKAAPKPFSELSLRQKVCKARSLPIHECLINAEYQENGSASVLIARRQPDGALMLAGCMVDIFCLGVKHALVKTDMDVASYQRIRGRLAGEQNLVPCDSALASEVVFGAVAYALSLGFLPMDESFREAQYVFDERQESASTGKVVFGQNGRPFYVAGPYDNVGVVMDRLRQRCGNDFEYFFPLGAGMDSDLRDAYSGDDWDDEDLGEDVNEDVEDEEDWDDAEDDAEDDEGDGDKRVGD